MTSRKRSYDDGCANAHALELIGERWALLVIRELMLGPKRFKDIQSGLPGISPNVLSQRLDELEAASIVLRRQAPPPVSARVYELTPWGYELEPIMQAIGRWAVRSPTKTLGPLSVNSLILSLRTMFDASKAQGLELAVGLELNGQSFRAVIADGALTVTAGAQGACDVSMSGDSNVIAAIIYGGQDAQTRAASGALRLTGDARRLKRFAACFPLPAPAARTQALSIS